MHGLQACTLTTLRIQTYDLAIAGSHVWQVHAILSRRYLTFKFQPFHDDASFNGVPAKSIMQLNSHLQVLDRTDVEGR